MVNDIASLKSSNSNKINDLLIEFNNSGKVHLLYENIFQYLPNSLQALGDNPLKILYQQTSQGLHNLTEQQCMAKAEQVDLVLKFVVKNLMKRLLIF